MSTQMAEYNFYEETEEGDRIEYAIESRPSIGMMICIPEKNIFGEIIDCHFRSTGIWVIRFKTIDNQKSAFLITKLLDSETVRYADI